MRSLLDLKMNYLRIFFWMISILTGILIVFDCSRLSILKMEKNNFFKSASLFIQPAIKQKIDESIEVQSFAKATISTNLAQAAKNDSRLTFNFPSKLFGKKHYNISLIIPKRFQKYTRKNERNKLTKVDGKVIPDASKLKVEILLSPKHKNCDQKLDFIMVLKSSADHFSLRTIVRQTWASVRHNYPSVRIFFLLGKSLISSINKRIVKESKKFDDIIQGSFEDSYRNLTVKTLFGMRWVYTNCRNARWMMSVDDDIYVNISNAFHFFSRFKIGNSRRKLFCADQFIRHGQVYRKGLWSVPFEKYNMDKFPPYCSGGCYIMSKDVFEDLYKMSLVTFTDISVDDVLITGVLREKINIQVPPLQKNICFSFGNYGKNKTERLLTAWNNRA